MKIKRIILDQRGTSSLAVEKCENWIIVKKAAEEAQKDQLLAVSDDLIKFLEYRELYKEELEAMLAAASESCFASLVAEGMYAVSADFIS